MHDPLTVAFTIRYPWRNPRYRNSPSKFLRTYHDPIITIWHKDPERGGDDDSCDWFHSHLGQAEKAIVSRLLDNPDDNLRGYFESGDDYHVRWLVGRIVQNTSRTIRPRHRWQHPRWHVWHWRLQVHPWQRLYRRLFERCATCGKSFAWNESPVAVAWEGKGPLYHMQCHGIEVAQTTSEVKQ